MWTEGGYGWIDGGGVTAERATELGSGSRASGRRWTRHGMKMYTQVWGGGRGQTGVECWLQGNYLSVNPRDLYYLQRSDSDWPQPTTDLSVHSTGAQERSLQTRNEPQSPDIDTETQPDLSSYLQKTDTQPMTRHAVCRRDVAKYYSSKKKFL